MKIVNIFFSLALAVSMMMTASCDSVKHCDSSVPYDIQNGRIVFQTPPRVEGQKSVLGLAVEPMKVVRVAPRSRLCATSILKEQQPLRKF